MTDEDFPDLCLAFRRRKQPLILPPVFSARGGTPDILCAMIERNFAI